MKKIFLSAMITAPLIFMSVFAYTPSASLQSKLETVVEKVELVIDEK